MTFEVEELVLRLGECFLGDVAENHGVIGLELGQVSGKRITADAPEPSILGATSVVTSISFSRSAFTSSACSPRVPFDQEHLGRAARVGEPFGLVIDRPAIAAVLVGDELGAERVKIRIGDDLLESFYVDPPLKFDRLRLFVAEGGSPIVVGLLEDLNVPVVGSLAWITTLMLTVSPFLTSGGIMTFSTNTSRSYWYSIGTTST